MMEQKSQLIFEIAPQEENLQSLMTFDDEFTEHNGTRILKVRLDKWLWAARFFKTRPLARAAIEHGKILYNGQKTLPSMEIEIGATVTLNQGRHRKSVLIKGLSTRRRNLDEGQALYEETESIYTNNLEHDPRTPHFDSDPCDENSLKARKTVRYLRRNMNFADSSGALKAFEGKE